ncbi:MAG TPA: cysteine--tRNA ligase [Planktothrix sp.]
MTTQLQVFNTLTGQKEPFVPLDGKTVRIYACGPTVYDFSHLGHARMAITWDVIQRWLRFSGYDVIFVRNITDVDDKIIKRAKEMNLRPEQVAREYTYQFWLDTHSLNCAQPDFEPRATEYIQHMIDYIKRLVDGGFAYPAKGDVYFDVSSFPEYGKLSKQNVDQLLSGAREQTRSQEELAEIKRSPVDFALWKGAPQTEPGWPSPWGYGRPGWHTECCAMIGNVLGETIDIHGGGEDLVFPHHENEIAQAESLNKKPFAKYWLHNGFVQVNAEKMSKSLGNFATIQDLLVKFPADAIRLLLLQTHYRNPIDFTPESLTGAKVAAQKLARAAAHAQPLDGKQAQFESVGNFERDFGEAMNNDFNTAIAVSELFNLADRIYQTDDPAEREACVYTLRKYANLLGLKLEDTRQVLDADISSRVVDAMLELRQSARAKKDYATSDQIRNALSQLGISVMDVKDGGSTWEKA